MHVDPVQSFQRPPVEAHDASAGIESEGGFPSVFEAAVAPGPSGEGTVEDEETVERDAGAAEARPEARRDAAEAEAAENAEADRATRREAEEQAEPKESESAEDGDAAERAAAVVVGPSVPAPVDAERRSLDAEARTDVEGRLSEIEGSDAGTADRSGGEEGASSAGRGMGLPLAEGESSEGPIGPASADTGTDGADRERELAPEPAAPVAEASVGRAGTGSPEADRAVTTVTMREALEPSRREASNEGQREAAAPPESTVEGREDVRSDDPARADDSLAAAASSAARGADAAEVTGVADAADTITATSSDLAEARSELAQTAPQRSAPPVAAVDGAPGVASPVAGTTSATTPSASPGAPAPAPASDAIALQTEWLAARGGGTARLVLHPPELGEMAIRVSLRAGSVEVVMVAQEAAAQAVAEEQSDRLLQAFANRDLRLEHFEVRRGASDTLAMSDDGAFDGSDADRDHAAEERGRPGGGGPGRGLERESGPPAPLPRIATVSPERGVDLRV